MIDDGPTTAGNLHVIANKIPGRRRATSTARRRHEQRALNPIPETRRRSFRGGRVNDPSEFSKELLVRGRDRRRHRVLRAQSPRCPTRWPRSCCGCATRRVCARTCTSSGRRATRWPTSRVRPARPGRDGAGDARGAPPGRAGRHPAAGGARRRLSVRGPAPGVDVAKAALGALNAPKAAFATSGPAPRRRSPRGAGRRRVARWRAERRRRAGEPPGRPSPRPA